jgi:hypothetical protein
MRPSSIERASSRRTSTPYRSDRNEGWLKIKTVKRGTFPVVGFGFSLSQDERDVLDWFEDVVDWKGRYQAPRERKTFSTGRFTADRQVTISNQLSALLLICSIKRKGVCQRKSKRSRSSRA